MWYVNTFLLYFWSIFLKMKIVDLDKKIDELNEKLKKYEGQDIGGWLDKVKLLPLDQRLQINNPDKSALDPNQEIILGRPGELWPEGEHDPELSTFADNQHEDQVTNEPTSEENVLDGDPGEVSRGESPGVIANDAGC